MRPALPSDAVLLAKAASRSAPPPPNVRAPIDVRSTSLVVMALLAITGFLFWAQAVFIPIVIALLASYALKPVVQGLRRSAKLPNTVGAALTLTLILIGLALGLNSLQSEAVHILDIVPQAATKFSATIRRTAVERPGTVEKITKAASELEKAADAAAAATNPQPAATAAPVQVAAPPSTFHLRDYLVMGTASAIAGISQLIVIVALVYVLLVAGNNFRRTLVTISGDTLSRKKLTLQILYDIDRQLQRYLLVQIVASALLGATTWIVFTSVGLDNALLWACAGAVLHLIPYIGPTILVAAVALVAYVQFDTLQPVFIIVGSTLSIVGTIGFLFVPWLTQRVGHLNAVTVFITLLFWGWLWGVWGLLLGVPIVMAINAVCNRVDGLQGVSAFLTYKPIQRKGVARPINLQLDGCVEDRKADSMRRVESP